MGAIFEPSSFWELSMKLQFNCRTHLEAWLAIIITRIATNIKFLFNCEILASYFRSNSELNSLKIIFSVIYTTFFHIGDDTFVNFCKPSNKVRFSPIQTAIRAFKALCNHGICVMMPKTVVVDKFIN